MIQPRHGARCATFDHQCLLVTETTRALEVVPAGAKWRLSYRKCSGGRIRTFVRFATNSVARRWCKLRGIPFPGDVVAPPAPLPALAPAFVGLDAAAPQGDYTAFHEPEVTDRKSRAAGDD